MTIKLIQRHSWLSLVLSVLFVVSYMHEISAQYKTHHHCGGEETSALVADDTLSLPSIASQFLSHWQIPDNDDKPNPALPAGDCSCAHCSPGVATLISPFARPGLTVSSSEFFPNQFLKPAKLSDGIDHPPNRN